MSATVVPSTASAPSPTATSLITRPQGGGASDAGTSGFSERSVEISSGASAVSDRVSQACDAVPLPLSSSSSSPQAVRVRTTAVATASTRGVVRRFMDLLDDGDDGLPAVLPSQWTTGTGSGRAGPLGQCTYSSGGRSTTAAIAGTRIG
ncbi:hypothetical protein [Blastococcus brunescens]|uniref:Uncharacterized protein n=1 Tax=Blastococcus brunescens TaxID=1564165 RepID=A0ABZ1B386_9ACTN|nr:hypothetical protein [Blastococcus sp. BMG 8361]WRL65276.1 hypothetical protein U6N30_06355 [Blastococcus sp. BMG 8361]